MVVTCPACGSVSQDREFCDRCNADLVPAPVAPPPATCVLPGVGPVELAGEDLARLSRPEAALTVTAGGWTWRLHWIAEGLGPRWLPRVYQRLGHDLECLPPLQLIEGPGGTWVVAEAGARPEPWAEARHLEPLEQVRRLADFLDHLAAALDELHAAGLVWLTFDPRELDEVDGRLCLANLDLAVYPAGQAPEAVTVLPAFAAPEVCRFREAELGPRTDVFHLALFAYYWLAKSLPHGFLGEGLEAFEFALPPLRTYAPALPPGFAGVLRRGTALAPAERFASAGELAAAFRSALERAERRWRTAAPVRVEAGCHTRTGRAKAAQGAANQDGCLVRRFSAPERVLAAVADGISLCDVGSGTLASRTVCEAVEAAFGPDSRAETFSREIVAACLQGARRLLQWALDHGQRPRLLRGQHLMGTTLTAAWLEGGWLTVANVGDSRAYLIDEAGAEQLTVDGDLGSALLAAGAPPEEVMQLGGLARALHECVGGCYRTPQGDLGIDEEHCRPALSRWPLRPGDVVVVCTDGLVDEGVFLEPAELAELVRRHRSLPAAALAEVLADAADARQRLPSAAEPEGFGDNVTCVVLRITP